MKRIRSLHRPNGRTKERAFLIEGQRAIADALLAGVKPDTFIVRAGDERLLDSLPFSTDIDVRRVSGDVFASVSLTVHPQGLIASVPIPTLRPMPTARPLILLIDGVRDPGNMGTLLRSAAAAGVSEVYVADETVDPWSPKVVRSAMGAHFRVPIRAGMADSLSALRGCDMRVMADPHSGATYDTVDWTRGAGLIIGGEALGPGGAMRQLANVRISIPMAAGMESLNAGVAGAVVLFEAARQRRVAGSQAVADETGAS